MGAGLGFLLEGLIGATWRSILGGVLILLGGASVYVLHAVAKKKAERSIYEDRGMYHLRDR